MPTTSPTSGAPCCATAGPPRRTIPNRPSPSTPGFATASTKNKPYDQFVREILTAEGELDKSPTLVWYREVKEPTAQVEDVAQLFLGQRIQCARCHHHPLEKWSQQDYYGLAAFFSRLEVKDAVPPKKGKKGKKGRRPAGHAGQALPRHLQARQGRGDQPADEPDGSDPRALAGRSWTSRRTPIPVGKLADWLTAKDNSVLRAGAGQPLLEALPRPRAGRSRGRPARHQPAQQPGTARRPGEALHRTQLRSEGSGARPSARRRSIASAWSRTPTTPATRRTSRASCRGGSQAEVLLDAIDTVTGSKTAFKGVPAATRAVQLPDNQFESYFLSAFGRPDSASACECERSGDASLAQALHLFNSEELLEKISGRKVSTLSSPSADSKDKKDKKGRKEKPKQQKRNSGPVGGRIRELMADKRPDQEKIERSLPDRPVPQANQGRDGYAARPHPEEGRSAGRLRGHPVGAHQHQGIPFQPLSEIGPSAKNAGDVS